ncbi:hypothetical protein [Streptomyces sp. Ru87]|uniref:hypothetical protein n=1 Tax=Streptomyces sp. Ru87 TaxID=2044307 RepID=UPI000BF840CB|nr:hypothetical protein [Streptomyces sp. Ru87]PGH49306.1 hypothetical protein CRI70_18365 [Streptomyces sp. Ru87]
MFEIRIICDPADTDRVTAALRKAFTTGTVRRLPSREIGRERLYLTADHRPEPEPWPTPEEAYQLAPSIVREIRWTADQAARRPLGTDLPREYWLRKAAVLDRIALTNGAGLPTGPDANDVATWAARKLMDLDNPPVTCDPRRYVRQQYAHWAKNH